MNKLQQDPARYPNHPFHRPMSDKGLATSRGNYSEANTGTKQVERERSGETFEDLLARAKEKINNRRSTVHISPLG